MTDLWRDKLAASVEGARRRVERAQAAVTATTEESQRAEQALAEAEAALREHDSSKGTPA